MAGLPALQDGESGQVRKEAATAIFCKCRGFGSPPNAKSNYADMYGVGWNDVAINSPTHS